MSIVFWEIVICCILTMTTNTTCAPRLRKNVYDPLMYHELKLNNRLRKFMEMYKSLISDDDDELSDENELSLTENLVLSRYFTTLHSQFLKNLSKKEDINIQDDQSTTDHYDLVRTSTSGTSSSTTTSNIKSTSNPTTNTDMVSTRSTSANITTTSSTSTVGIGRSATSPTSVTTITSSSTTDTVNTASNTTTTYGRTINGSTTPNLIVPKVLFRPFKLKFRNANGDESEFTYYGLKCKRVADRILCGYEQNKGTVKDKSKIIDLGNGCIERYERIECGYPKTNNNDLNVKHDLHSNEEKSNITSNNTDTSNKSKDSRSRPLTVFEIINDSKELQIKMKPLYSAGDSSQNTIRNSSTTKWDALRDNLPNNTQYEESTHELPSTTKRSDTNKSNGTRIRECIENATGIFCSLVEIS